MVTWPDDWEDSTIGDLFNVSVGGDVDRLPFSEFHTPTYKYEIFSNGVENRGLYGYSSKALYPADSLTVTARGTIGRTFYRDKDFNAVIRLLVLIPRSKKVCARFYAYYIDNQVKFIRESTGVAQLTAPKIREIRIPLPPLDEQIAIADTLSAFDRHLANLSELIAKHEGIRAGALEDLLSGRTRLPGFSGAWRTVKLGELGKVKMCRRVFHSQTQSYGQVPFFKIGTFNTEPDAYISRELFEEYKRLYPYPKKGNVLLSAAGTIGRTFFFDGRDAYFQDSNIVWLDADPAKVDGRFLMYFYQTYPWRNLEGTAIRRLYNKMILDTAINLPPVDEQIAIAETLSALDLNISNLKAEHAKISALRTAAINDLLTAKIRLPC